MNFQCEVSMDHVARRDRLQRQNHHMNDASPWKHQLSRGVSGDFQDPTYRTVVTSMLSRLHAVQVTIEQLVFRNIQDPA